MPDSLGDRMKRAYEDRYRISLTRRTPVIIRLDGRAFHTFTSKMTKPFDKRFMDCMASAVTHVAKDMQGFKAAYIQSDEVSFLLTDYDRLETEAWFDYNLQKITTIAASMMSVKFGFFFALDKCSDKQEIEYWQHMNSTVFDGRAFNIPKEEVVNYFLWRQKDWERNSLSMYARSFFSHKELMNKNTSDMHEMLHGIGKNWATDLTPQQKNGLFITKVLRDTPETENAIMAPLMLNAEIIPNYDEVAKILNPLIYGEPE